MTSPGNITKEDVGGRRVESNCRDLKRPNNLIILLFISRMFVKIQRFINWWDGYQCGHCGEEFSTKDDLNEHMEDAHA